MLPVEFRIEERDADVIKIEGDNGRQRGKPSPVAVQIVQHKHVVRPEWMDSRIMFIPRRLQIYKSGRKCIPCGNRPGIRAGSLHVQDSERRGGSDDLLWTHIVGQSEEHMQRTAHAKTLPPRQSAVQFPKGIKRIAFIDHLRQNNVKVISVTEGIDSSNENDDLLIGFKQIFNDFYAKDTSKKDLII